MNTPAGNPFEGKPRKHAAGLQPIEMMGVLMVRLIHDLSNQLTILAGNAQVLEMVRNHPERLGKVIERIKNSSANAGTLIDRFARFRQEMGLRARPHSLTECRRDLDTLNPQTGGWLVDARGDLAGEVALESRWVAFAVWQVAILCGAPRGQVTLSAGGFPADWPAPAYVPSRLREKKLFRCELAWSGPGPWMDDKEAAKPNDLALATAYEILKIVDGWAHYQFSADATHRYNLFFPLIT
jgi:hypothetical protein